MKWLVNSGWWLGNRHSRRAVTSDLSSSTVREGIHTVLTAFVSVLDRIKGCRPGVSRRRAIESKADCFQCGTTCSARRSLSLRGSVAIRYLATCCLSRVILFGETVAIFCFVLLSACTDYVSQIDDRYGEWETSDSIVKSSSSKKTDSSSSATSSDSNADISAGSEYDATAKTLLDLRDSQIYKTVTIGSQTCRKSELRS